MIEYLIAFPNAKLAEVRRYFAEGGEVIYSSEYYLAKKRISERSPLFIPTMEVNIYESPVLAKEIKKERTKQQIYGAVIRALIDTAPE